MEVISNLKVRLWIEGKEVGKVEKYIFYCHVYIKYEFPWIGTLKFNNLIKILNFPK